MRVSGPWGERSSVSGSSGASFCTESLERGESSLGQPTSTCSSGSAPGSTSSSIESYSSLEPSFSFLCRLTLSSRLFLSSCQSQEEKEKMKYVPLRKTPLKIDHRNQRTISIKLTFTKTVSTHVSSSLWRWENKGATSNSLLDWATFIVLIVVSHPEDATQLYVL